VLRETPPSSLETPVAPQAPSPEALRQRRRRERLRGVTPSDVTGSCHGVTPEQDIYLRTDLYLARRGSGRDAAE
jgi:hypothetical protein